MKIKTDSRGVTLIELIIAVSLLTIFLSSAYFLFFNAFRSLNDTEAQFDAGEDARVAEMEMEEDIRTAQAVSYESTYHKAVEVSADGLYMKVHSNTDDDDELEIVEYKLENNQLKRRESSLAGVAGDWCIVAGRVKNGMTTPITPIFKIDSVNKKLIIINLIVLDEKDQLTDDPVSVKTSIAVRSKGAMD